MNLHLVRRKKLVVGGRAKGEPWTHQGRSRPWPHGGCKPVTGEGHDLVAQVNSRQISKSVDA